MTQPDALVMGSIKVDGILMSLNIFGTITINILA